MKALTVRQPWADLIALGHKSIELRTWYTNYRGPFVLCSSASPIDRGRRVRFGNVPGTTFETGVTLAVVKLVDVREASSLDQYDACCSVARGEYAWRLHVVNSTIPRVHVKGKLGWWSLPDDVVNILARAEYPSGLAV